MPGVIVGLPLGDPAAHGQDRLARSRAWHCDFPSTHSTTALSGGFRSTPTTSRTFASSRGSGHGRRQDLTDRLVRQHRPRAARPQRVRQPGQAVLGALPPPLDDSRLRAPHPLRDAAAATNGDALRALDGVDQAFSDLDARVRILAGRHEEEDGETYAPADNVNWHRLRGEELEKAMARLRSWVTLVYKPGFGHLAQQLPSCWDKHRFCWYALDWLSELWSVLWLPTKRSPGTLAGQGEFMTRVLLAAAEQMAREAKNCSGHHA
jgi:hypothetical protein